MTGKYWRIWDRSPTDPNFTDFTYIKRVDNTGDTYEFEVLDCYRKGLCELIDGVFPEHNPTQSEMELYVEWYCKMWDDARSILHQIEQTHEQEILNYWGINRARIDAAVQERIGQ